MYQPHSVTSPAAWKACSGSCSGTLTVVVLGTVGILAAALAIGALEELVPSLVGSSQSGTDGPKRCSLQFGKL